MPKKPAKSTNKLGVEPAWKPFHDGVAPIPENLSRLVRSWVIAQRIIALAKKKRGTDPADPWRTGQRSAGGLWVPAPDDRPQGHAMRLADQAGLLSLRYILDSYRKPPVYDIKWKVPCCLPSEKIA